jgi:FKBP-type peptidyl-prolyl cis-trans isomerase
MYGLFNLATRSASATAFRNFTTTAAIMGVTKTITKEGNGPMPKKGQTVAMAYTGWLKNTSKPFNREERQYVEPSLNLSSLRL